MLVHTCQLTINEKGTLTLTNLPFNAGEQVEVIVILRSNRQHEEKRYRFWEEPVTYLDPAESVAEKNWKVLQ